MSRDCHMVRCSAILIPVSRLGFGRTGFQERSIFTEGKAADTSTPYLYNRELGLMSFDFAKEEIGQWFEVEPYWKDVDPNAERLQTGAIHATIQRRVTQKVEIEALVTNEQRYNYYNGIAIALYVEKDFMTVWNDHLGIIIHFGTDLYDKFSPLQPVNFKATPVCEHRFSAFTAVKVSAAKQVKLSHLFFGKHAEVKFLNNGFAIAKCQNGDQVFLLDEKRAPMPLDAIDDGMLVDLAYYRIQLHDGPIFISAYVTNEFDYFDEPFDFLCNGRKIKDELFPEFASASSSVPRRSPKDLKELLEKHFTFFNIDNTDMQWMVDMAHLEVAESVCASRVSANDSTEDEREAEKRQPEKVGAAEQEPVHFPDSDSSEEDERMEEAPAAAHTAISDSGTFIISKNPAEKKEEEVIIEEEEDSDEFRSIPDVDLDIENRVGILSDKKQVYRQEEDFTDKNDDELALVPKPVSEEKENKAPLVPPPVQEEKEEKYRCKAPIPADSSVAEKPMIRLSNPLQNNAVEAVPAVPSATEKRNIIVEQARKIVWDSQPGSLKADDFGFASDEFLNTKEADIQNASGTPLSRYPSRTHPSLDPSIPASLGSPSPLNNSHVRESPENNSHVRESPENNSYVRESPVNEQLQDLPRCSPEMTAYHSARGSPYSIPSFSPSVSPTVPSKTSSPSKVGQPLGKGGPVPSSMRDIIRKDWPPPARPNTTPSPNSGGRSSAAAAPVGQRNCTSRLSTSSSSTNGESLRRVRNDSVCSSTVGGTTLKFGPKKDDESYEAYLERTMSPIDSQESRLIRLALNEIYTSSKMRDVVKKYFPGLLPVIKRLFEKPTEVNLAVLERFQLNDKFESSGCAHIDRITLENQVFRLVKTASRRMWQELVKEKNFFEDVTYV